MRRASGGKMSGARAGLALAVGLALGLVTWWRWRRPRPRPRPVREVLFFPSQPSCTEALLAEAAGPGSAKLRPCPCPLPRLDCSLSRLLRRLLSARRSLDLCLFAFCSPQLGQAVRILHRRGVRVRLLTDAMSMGFSGSQIGLLRQAGIQVRHDEKTGYMHHKFAVVDRRILITGSLNWTTQAIQNNRENVLILEDVECVKSFLDEFERIWGEYDPSNYTFFPQRQ